MILVIDWSFQSLFDRTVNRACPAAAESLVRVTLPKNEGYTIMPEPTSMYDDVAVYNAAEGELSDTVSSAEVL
jgi:phosphatidylinositol glycan class T